ncbi:trans-aconitate 2-methyltransferase [Methanoregula sp.]|uniref:class I SAM-dependent methyltransferase n=1 Tax=Methanoregula sp. TaxID=2052170 RepID=UPI000CAF3984|nr:class I SAM-dependent methyltransferase [Methanoregula sp.]PKG33215.1 MAG: SAM-dependent methyltransferase [Methanoregula sp.]
MTPGWIAYNDLAWVDDYLTGPAEYEEEVRCYIGLLEQQGIKPPGTLLHLGCGAGGHDRIFRQYFSVTGVDISPGMLARARAAHPDIGYLEGDMRSIRLNRRFDAVVIPDSIDYMVTIDDLRQAIHTAVTHLRPGGVLLVVGKTEETFRNNNFVYTGERDGTHVTLFENNYRSLNNPGTYEAVLVYLIRQKEELSIQTERHELGLFPLNTWEQVFRENGIEMMTTRLDGIYDPYLQNDGEYSLTVFTGKNESGHYWR